MLTELVFAEGTMKTGKLKSKIGLLLILSGVLLILGAAGYVGYDQYSAYKAGQAAAEILEEMPAIAPTEDPAAAPAPEYLMYQDRDMPVMTIKGRYYIGVLEIPSRSLKLPVLSEWSYEGLKIAPCRYSGSLYRRDLVIAGHNYRKHFTGIKSLNPGDEVIFTDAEGHRFPLKVNSGQVIRPYGVDEMINDENNTWDMTLFTCTSGGSARYALRCSLDY